MTKPFKSRIALRVILAVLSCVLLGVSFQTTFSDAPANGALVGSLMLAVAACLLQLANLDRQDGVK